MKLISLLVSLICGFAIAFATSDGDVRKSLDVRGVPAPDAIQLPQAFSAGCRSPLEIKQQIVAGSSLWVRFRCRGEGRPFYAILTYRSGKCLEQARALIGSHVADAESRLPIVIHPGQVVQLVLRSGGIVLRQPVTSLQAGRKGQRIRVRDEARRTYLASVKGENLVEAEL